MKCPNLQFRVSRADHRMESVRDTTEAMIISQGPTLPATVPVTGDSKQDGHSLPASNSWSIELGRLVR